MNRLIMILASHGERIPFCLFVCLSVVVVVAQQRLVIRLIVMKQNYNPEKRLFIPWR